jgi:hypothetical protein
MKRDDLDIFELTGGLAVIPMLAILAIKFVLPFVLAGLALIVLAIFTVGLSTTQVGILVLRILGSKLLYILLGGWFAVKFALFELKLKRNRR